MNRTTDWELILKYLERDCSEIEKRDVLEWEGESEENKKELELLKNIWNTQEDSLPKPDVVKALDNVKHKISSITETETIESANIFKLKQGRKGKTLNDYLQNLTWLKAAAVILIFFVGIYLLTRITIPSPMKMISVENQKQEEVILSDGSIVKLDAGSVFKFPEDFEDEIREVFLNGEGYFEVTPNPQTPFIVHANEAKITVLGTQFNVRAWSRNKKVIVAVADGKVSFQREDNDEEKARVVVSKGQISTLEQNGKPSIPKDVDVKEYLTWMDNEINFQNVQLGEILEQLERWYNIRFSLPEESFEEERVTMFIENKPIEDILDVISLIMDFEYERKGDRIIFSIKEKK